MPRLEEIVYDAGRAALADQAALVSDIRQRTAVLLAAHALVASFLGAAAIRAHGLQIKPPSISIGIQEGRGGSTPPPAGPKK